jgi:alkylation response protein AidB-like acyl-CoA dehydrogenase
VTLERKATVISYAMEADGIVTTARRAPDAAASDQVLLVLLKRDYTLERLQSWDTLGMRGTHSEGFTLRARAPAQQILPDPYEKIHPQTMVPHAHLLWGSVWAGIAAAATAKAQAFVRNALRASGGQMPPGAAHFTQAVSSLRTLRGVLGSALRSYQAVMMDEKAHQGAGLRACRRHRARRAARVRPLGLPQRQRVQHRPASAGHPLGPAHDQQRPHPRQSRDDFRHDLAADLDQWLKKAAFT